MYAAPQNIFEQRALRARHFKTESPLSRLRTIHNIKIIIIIIIVIFFKQFAAGHPYLFINIHLYIKKHITIEI